MQELCGPLVIALVSFPLDKAVHPSAQFSVGKMVVVGRLPVMHTLQPNMLLPVLLLS
jgi:hypothetical protein